MNKIYVLSALILIVFCFSFSKKKYHQPTVSTGISGKTVAGCTCHNPMPDGNVSVNLTGLPANPIVGNTYDLVLNVSGTNPLAGFDLAVNTGTLSTLFADAQVLNGELTHTAPKALVGGKVSWNVRWKPNAVGAVKFTFASNNVDGDGSNDSDDIWNKGSLSSNIVLPVTLTSFDATSTSAGIKLIWKIEQELNFKQYIIEKSCNGIAFEPVGAVTPTANNNAKQYTYTDATTHCNTEKTFYRLKMEDLDASFKYSSIISVTTPIKEGEPFAFPNPLSKNSAAINLYVGKTAPQNIQLYDNNGVLIYTNNKPMANENKIVLPSNIKSGNYYFKINYAYADKVVRFIVN